MMSVFVWRSCGPSRVVLCIVAVALSLSRPALAQSPLSLPIHGGFFLFDSVRPYDETEFFASESEQLDIVIYTLQGWDILAVVEFEGDQIAWVVGENGVTIDLMLPSTGLYTLVVAADFEPGELDFDEDEFLRYDIYARVDLPAGVLAAGPGKSELFSGPSSWRRPNTLAAFVPIRITSTPDSAEVFMIPWLTYQNMLRQDSAFMCSLRDSFRIQQGRTSVVTNQEQMTYMAVLRRGSMVGTQRVRPLGGGTTNVYVELQDTCSQ